jgi:IS5 family transposase
LKAALAQAEKLSGLKCEDVYVDRGYQGAAKYVQENNIHIAGRRLKNLTRTALNWLKRRSAIEPIIGHMKSDNRMDRNYLKGKDGDRMNAIFAGSGFNFRKLIRILFCLVLKISGIPEPIKKPALRPLSIAA